MPSYRFRLQGSVDTDRTVWLDAPDASLISLVAKHAARRLVSREIASGRLPLASEIVVSDAGDAEVARYRLSDLIEVA